MPFPLRVGMTVIESGPALVRAIVEDVEKRALVPGKTPVEWVVELVERETLAQGEVRGLTAALIQRGTPETVSVGLRLARYLRTPDFGPLLLHALAGLDIGTLLSLDPLEPEKAIEDALLDACVAVVDLSQDSLRPQLLERLRNAGHNQDELEILARHGTPSEIRIWLPAVLSEYLPGDWLGLLHEASKRGDDVVAAVEDALAQLKPERRSQVLSQLGH